MHALSWKHTGTVSLHGSCLAGLATVLKIINLCSVGGRRTGELLLTGCDVLTLWEESTLPGQSTITMWRRLWEQRYVRIQFPSVGMASVALTQPSP